MVLVVGISGRFFSFAGGFAEWKQGFGADALILNSFCFGVLFSGHGKLLCNPKQKSGAAQNWLHGWVRES